MEKRRIAMPLGYLGVVPEGVIPIGAEIEIALRPHPIGVYLTEAEFEAGALNTGIVSCAVNGEEFPIVLPPAAQIDAAPVDGDDPRGVSILEEFLVENREALDTLAQYAGLYGIKRLLFHVGRASARAPFPIRSKDELDVLIFTAPIVSREKDTLKSICGLPLSENGKGMPFLLSHCPLRGGVVFEEEQAVVQYIDNTIYMLFHPATLTERGGVYADSCFLQIMFDIIVLWYTEQTGYEDVDAALRPVLLPIDDDGVVTEIARAEKTVRDECAREILDTRSKITSLEGKLLEARRLLLALERKNALPLLFDAAGRIFDEKHRNELLENMRRFREHPLVAKLEIVSGLGVHLVTNEVRIEHESVLYRIGTFEALFQYEGSIDIWPVVTHHPEGIPHPHIDRETGMCFGNVSDTIKRALAEYRFADAIEFFLLSLDEGYTHENVVYHPVTEWPTVNTAEVQ